MISELNYIAIRLGGTGVGNPIADGNSAASYSVGNLISNAMIYFIFPFAFLFSIVLIAIGAFRIILSGGNPGSVSGGRSMIINSVIGLIIISLAWAITAFISQAVLNVYVTP